MSDLQKMINFYHTAFLVLLILSIVFLVLSIFLFFWFDIRGIYDLRSGRGARKTIQRMQELNDQTGRLRDDMVTGTPVVLKGEDRIQAPVTERRHGEPATEMLRQGSGSVPGTEQTTLLGQNISDPAGATTLLDQSGADPAGATTVLSPNASQHSSEYESQDVGATTVLQPNMAVPGEEETTVLSQQGTPGIELPGLFVIEKQLMWTHTEEVL